MQQTEIEKIRKNPLKEVKRRFRLFCREEVIEEYIDAEVSSIIVNGKHRISVKASSKNYYVKIEIAERRK